MIGTLGKTAKTLSYQLLRQEVAANNIAQANTAGYKSIHIAAQSKADEVTEPVQWTRWTQGALRETGNALDVALDGPGFLVVKSDEGEKLIRGGSLELDRNGTLTDLSGNPVLSESGLVHLFGNTIEFQVDGTVFVDGVPAAKLRIERVGDPSLLVREGEGIYAAAEPSRPVPEGSVGLRQGHIEDSNVDPVISLVELISIQRSYMANMQVLKAVDRIMGISATEVGSPD